jgi:hypothetical protein
MTALAPINLGKSTIHHNVDRMTALNKNMFTMTFMWLVVLYFYIVNTPHRHIVLLHGWSALFYNETRIT